MGTRIAIEFTSENNFGRIIKPAPEDGGGGMIKTAYAAAFCDGW